MEPRVRRLYEAMFALEDLREIFRESVPGRANEDEIAAGVARVERILKDFKERKSSSLKYITDHIELRTREEEYININPIQPGGRLTPEARKALIAYGDGYSVCDWCLNQRLDKIRRPPVDEFHAELAEFVGMDEVRVVPGARRGFQIVTSSLLNKGDIVLLPDLGHYTEYLAVEIAGGVVREIPSGESNIITGDAVADTIEQVRATTGKVPKLVIVEHFDYSFGNE
ncbi:MAG: hypothetical protein J7I99_01845, partial [Methanophagales archaeon]|nr:hypothetical protein [Methanophagales archaeon]